MSKLGGEIILNGQQNNDNKSFGQSFVNYLKPINFNYLPTD